MPDNRHLLRKSSKREEGSINIEFLIKLFANNNIIDQRSNSLDARSRKESTYVKSRNIKVKKTKEVTKKVIPLI